MFTDWVDTYPRPVQLMLTISQKTFEFPVKKKLKEKNKERLFIYLLRFEIFNFSLSSPPRCYGLLPFLFNFYYSRSEAENQARTLLSLQLFSVILFEE